MTSDRYMEWKSAIAEARAAGDMKRLASIQLDYNLELGECLAHQSQRTKDIRTDLAEVKEDLTSVTTAVNAIDGRLGALESAVARTADNVSELAKSVRGLISYHHDVDMKKEGIKSLGRTVKIVACGIAVVTGWGYAIYQFVVSYLGK